MHLLKAVFNRQKTTGAAHFFRYALVSGAALAVDITILIICHDALGMHYLPAATVGFLVGVVVNYALGVAWVFSGSRFNKRSVEFLLTAAFATAGLIINDFMMWLMVDNFAIHYTAAKIMAAAAVFFWNFVIRQYYVHAPVAAQKVTD